VVLGPVRKIQIRASYRRGKLAEANLAAYIPGAVHAYNGCIETHCIECHPRTSFRPSQIQILTLGFWVMAGHLLGVEKKVSTNIVQKTMPRHSK